MDMNVVEILSQIIEEEFNTTKQNEIAKILDIQPGQLSTYLKNNSAGKNVIKKMLFAFAEEYAQRQLYTKANPTKTIVEVVETSFKTQNQGESAKILGINQGQLSSYINKNNAGNNAIKNMLNDLVGHIRTTKFTCCAPCGAVAPRVLGPTCRRCVLGLRWPEMR
jgi:predicted transcriptional regulator